MPVAEILGAAQLFVAVMQLQLHIWMTPARFLHKETDTQFDWGQMKFRRRTKITRRQ